MIGGGGGVQVGVCPAETTGAVRRQVLQVDTDNGAVLEGYKYPSLRIGVLYRRWSNVVVALRSPFKVSKLVSLTPKNLPQAVRPTNLVLPKREPEKVSTEATASSWPCSALGSAGSLPPYFLNFDRSKENSAASSRFRSHMV